MNVLIVEDNADSRKLLVKQLSAYGHKVTAAANGVDALKKGIESPPDILVSDILMPRMDGYKLCYEWKHHKQLKGIPFVFYTAIYTSGEDEKFAMSLGANLFIRKPIEPEVLARTLSQVFEQAREGLLPPTEAPPKPSLYLTEYNERLVAKLNEEVAELEKSEKRLRESEEKYRNVVELASDGICVIQDGQVKYANSRQAEMWGGSVEEIIDTPFVNYVHPDDIPRIVDLYNRRTAGEKVPSLYEAALRRKDGTKAYAELSVGVIDYLGKPAELVVTHDITERKRLQANLEKERQDLKLIIDSSPIIIFYKDKEGRFLRVNKAFAEALKMPEEDFVGKTVFDFYSTEIAQGMTNDDEQVIKSGRPKLNIIEKYESASGLRWVRTDKIPLIDSDGIATGLVGFAQDITESKLAEEEIARLARFPNENPAPVLRVAKDGTVLYANKAASPLLKEWKCQIGQKLPEYWRNFILAVIRSASNKDVEMAVSKRILNLTFTPVAEEGYVNLYGLEITERKRAEEALKQSEEKFKGLAESITDIFFAFDKDLRYTYWNKASEELTGIAAKDALGKHLREIFPESVGIEKAEKMYLKALKTQKVQSFVNEFQLRDKGYFFEINVYPSKDGLSVFVKDITERRKAEEALRESNKRFTDIAENALQWIWEVDAKGKYTYVSPVVEQILGYKPEEVIGKHFYDLFHPDDREQAKKAALAAFAEKQPFHQFLNRNVHKNGKTVWLSTSGVPIVDEAGEFLGYRGSDVDITESKQAEQMQQGENYILTLLGQGAKLSELLDAIVRLGEQHDPSIKGSLLLLDPLKSNELLFQASGPSLPDAYTKTLKAGIPIGPVAGSCGTAAYRRERVIVPDIAQSPLFKPHTEVVKQILENNLRAVWSQPIIASNGELFGTIANYSSQVGEPSADNLRVLEWSARIAAIAIERRRAEEALRDSEARYRAVIEGAHDMIQSVSFDGSLIFVNKSWLDTLGYTEADLSGLNLFDIIHPDYQQHCREMMDEVAKGKSVPDIEAIFLTKDGREILVEGSAAPRYIGNKAVASHGIFRDVTESKKAEDALRKSEEKFFKAFRSSPNAMALTTLKDGRFLEVNDGFLRLNGLSREEVIGRTSKELGVWVNPKDRVRILRIMREKGGVADVEYKSRTKSGEIRTMLFSAEPIDIAGERCMISSATDITERKRAEAALADEATRHHILIDESSDGIVVLDEQGKVYEANRRFAEMLGYTPKEVRKLSVWDWEFQFPREQVAEMIRTVDEKGDRFETKHRRKDGTVYDVEISTNGAIYAGQKLIFCVCRDITERKQAETALRQEEEKLRVILESIPQGVTVTDLEGKILEVNNAVLRLHGYNKRQKLIGRNAFELIAEEGHARATASLKKTLETGHSGAIEYTFIRKDGTTFPAQLSAALIRDESAKPIGFVAVTEDITERRHMQEQLVITDRLASVGELAAGIAHELNNPLTGVIGFSQLLLDKEMPKDVRQDMEVVFKEAQRASQVVRNLLTFARKHAAAKEKVDINEVIGKVLELRAYEQNLENIKVDARLNPELPEVMADYFQLQQVFLNIIINAEYFMKEAHRKGKLTITTERVDNRVRASFTDDGPGIAKEAQGHIFDPFFTTKEVGKGTGLGLSICHGIIAEHGGRIYVESELGKGATFIVELPVGAVRRKGGAA
jgi:two-component system NtrC family sensor kinase